MSDSDKEVAVPEKKGRGRPSAVEKSDDKVKKFTIFRKKFLIQLLILFFLETQTRCC